MTLDEVNAAAPEAFLALFGGIAEHTSWVAERALSRRPYQSRRAMVEAFQNAVTTATVQEQRRLIEAHPDLAGKAALAGDVGPDSAREQAGAGLDTLTADEFARFSRLNAMYRERFGFPFIFAVRGATKHQILDSFAARVDGGTDEEFLTALAQVLRIIRFRLEDRVRDDRG